MVLHEAGVARRDGGARVATSVAGRLKRPTWTDPRLLVGVILIGVSVAGVVTLLRQADESLQVYQAVGTLPAGTVLSAADVALTSARVDPDLYVQDADDLRGMVVTRTVGDGELVPAGAVTTPEGFDGRPVAIVTALPLSSTVVPGALVDVWLTVEGPDGVPVSERIGDGLVVQAVDDDEAAFGIGGQQTVHVVVPASLVATVLEATASDGELSVVGGAGD